MPNPFQTIAPWGKVTDRKWGALNDVAIDNDGTSVWVVERRGANPDVPPGVSPPAYSRRRQERGGRNFVRYRTDTGVDQ